MLFEDLPDNELADCIKNGEMNAFTVLLERYIPVLQHTASRYSNIAGVDMDDFMQEGMLALYRAARGYRPEHGTQFNTYAITCITNAMAGTAKKQFREIPQEANLYLDDMGERALHQVVMTAANRGDEDIFSQKETSIFRMEKIETLLSDFERQVLRMYLDGASYQDISRDMQTTTKAVDNALQRVRRKLRDGS